MVINFRQEWDVCSRAEFPSKTVLWQMALTFKFWIPPWFRVAVRALEGPATS